MVSTFGGNRPSYQLVLQFDTAVRNFPIIPKMDLSDCREMREDPPLPAEVNIVRWLGVSSKESSEWRSLNVVEIIMLTISTPDVKRSFTYTSLTFLKFWLTNQWISSNTNMHHPSSQSFGLPGG